MNDIIVENLSFGYTEDKVLENLNFTCKNGEMVVIIGGNGVGKSTLMKLILGELEPDCGSIKLMGKNASNITDFREVGSVPQGNIVNEVPFPITCLEFVVLEFYYDFGLIKVPKKRHKERAKNMLREMGLDKYINTPFNELSGGLQQRVMISRAMLNDPKILILDEPTSGVDEESKIQFAEVVQDLNDNLGKTIILITHELDWAQSHLNMDHIYELKDGGLTNVSV